MMFECVVIPLLVI